MAKYFYKNKNGENIFIKNIDFANGKLSFTKNVCDAYRGRGGYYAAPLRDSIIFGFSEEYPEVKDIQIYDYDDD